jgi:hypothetical protein
MQDQISSPHFRANEVRAFLSPTRRLQEEKEILNFAIIIHRTHDITPQESRLMKHIRKNASPSQIELSKTVWNSSPTLKTELF